MCKVSYLCQSGSFLQFFIFVFTSPHLLRLNFNYHRPRKVMKANSFLSNPIIICVGPFLPIGLFLSNIFDSYLETAIIRVLHFYPLLSIALLEPLCRIVIRNGKIFSLKNISSHRSFFTQSRTSVCLIN